MGFAVVALADKTFVFAVAAGGWALFAVGEEGRAFDLVAVFVGDDADGF